MIDAEHESGVFRGVTMRRDLALIPCCEACHIFSVVPIWLLQFSLSGSFLTRAVLAAWPIL